MKPCGRTMMDRKGWGGESSTHRVCRAVHSASLAHTQRVPSSALSFACAHTACVEQCTQLRLRTHSVCRAVRSASLAHTQRVSSSALSFACAHTECAEQCAQLRLRTHTECAGQCAAYACAHTQSVPDSARHTLAHTSFLMFSLYGKYVRMFYAFRSHVSLRSSSKTPLARDLLMPGGCVSP